MSDRKLALWLINRVARAEWDHDAMVRALAGGFLGIGGNTVRLGQRPNTNCGPGILMNEDEQNDEYFIPIPVKCLGNPDSLQVPAATAPKLKEITDFYNSCTQYFDPAGDFNW